MHKGADTVNVGARVCARVYPAAKRYSKEVHQSMEGNGFTPGHGLTFLFGEETCKVRPFCKLAAHRLGSFGSKFLWSYLRFRG